MQTAGGRHRPSYCAVVCLASSEQDMSDTARSRRRPPVSALFMAAGGVCELVGSYFLSLSSPNLFPFAIMFTAGVVLIGIAVYSWYECVQDSKARD